MENSKTIATWSIIVILLIVGVSTVFSTFETIHAGERGIVLRWGAVERILGEGFHVVNPISSDIIVMNVKVVKYESAASAASRDLQTVSSEVALNYHIDPQGVGKLYQEVGLEYESQIIKPAIQEAVKAATAKFTAEELISRRSEAKAAIKEDLTARLTQFHVVVNDLSITNFDFSTEFNRAIELKQVAEQKALQAENDLRRVELEAKQEVEKFKAEAESTRLQVQALQQGGQIIELRKAEALLELAKKWKGDVPTTMYMMGESGILPLLNLK